MKKPDVLENDDTRAWFTELERHHMGQFSMAAYQANSIMEDYSQVEVGDNNLFVGIYDGHDGTNAAKFISHHILEELSCEFLFSISYINHLRFNKSLSTHI
jgi:serine/threonine protein phosphatase PrpC